MEALTFSWVDYTLFAIMLCISLAIGVFYGCFGSKQSTTTDYLLGGKAMKIFPIAMSLVASNLSGIALLGTPAEIYVYGTQYSVCILCNMISTIFLFYIYLPVFYKLQLTSSFEYLRLRFDSRIKTLTSFLFIIKTMLYIPIVIYAPAMAFNQVSNVNIHYLTPILCAICITYTTLGGLKAVVWTDTFQMIIMIATMAVVFVLDVSDLETIGTVWKNAEDSGRIEIFNFSLDPTERCTFWGIVVGMTTLWIASCTIDQSSLQRYLALPTLKDAKKSAIYFGVGVVIIKLFSFFSGLIMYSKYKDCDPISSGQVKKMDQILPFYVLDMTRDIPGLSGVFISGIISAVLSTMSTSLNTLSGVIFEDFLVPWKRFNFSEENGSRTMKILVVVLGSLCVSLVFVIEKLKGVIQIALSFSGITNGPILGVFTLGMLFPTASTAGVFWGSITSLIFVSFICIGQQVHQMLGHIKYPTKPVSVAGCVNFTNNITSTITATNNEPLWLFRISFHWFSLIGLVITMVMALGISRFAKDDKAVDKNLLSPCVYNFLGDDYVATDKSEYEPVELKRNVNDEI